MILIVLSNGLKIGRCCLTSGNAKLCISDERIKVMIIIWVTLNLKWSLKTKILEFGSVRTWRYHKIVYKHTQKQINYLEFLTLLSNVKMLQIYCVFINRLEFCTVLGTLIVVALLCKRQTTDWKDPEMLYKNDTTTEAPPLWGKIG